MVLGIMCGPGVQEVRLTLLLNSVLIMVLLPSPLSPIEAEHIVYVCVISVVQVHVSVISVVVQISVRTCSMKRRIL